MIIKGLLDFTNLSNKEKEIMRKIFNMKKDTISLNELNSKMITPVTKNEFDKLFQNGFLIREKRGEYKINWDKISLYKSSYEKYYNNIKRSTNSSLLRRYLISFIIPPIGPLLVFLTSKKLKSRNKEIIENCDYCLEHLKF